MSSVNGLGSYIEHKLSLARDNEGSRNLSDLQDDLQSSISQNKVNEIEQKAKEFEAVFINQMLKIMFEDVKPNEIFGGGKTEEVFQSFILEEYSESIAESGGIGIAENITKQLLSLQEVS